jgi:hypothetical protein
MPLSLRRRPRLPPLEPAPFSEPSVAHAEAPPTGGIPESAGSEASAATASQPVRRRTARGSRRRPHAGWHDRMLGEVFFFLVGLGVWLSNASFTVLGVTAPVGLTPLTGLLGFLFHLLLSRAELYLWYRWRDPWYLLLLVGCVLLDTGTTLVGLIPVATRWFPLLVGSTPPNVLDWSELLAVLMGTTALPAWWLNALALLVIAVAFALGSERLMRRFYRGMVETWQERSA